MLILSPELRLVLAVLRYVALGVAIGGTALGLATAQMAAEAFVLVYGLSWAAAHGTTIAVQRGLLRLPEAQTTPTLERADRGAAPGGEDCLR
jgi:hypothetical protein